jgi:hypothetical protein
MKDILILSALCAIVFSLMIGGVGLVLKDFKEQLNSMKVLRVTAFVVISSPIITYAILDISRILKKYQLVEAIGSADAWIGFAGSIIGGSITMLALYLTFIHEREVGRQQYIESIKPYITCRISNYDEFERSIDVENCLNDYGFIQWKMKNISPNIANIRYIDQYVSIEHAKGEYVKQENLEQQDYSQRYHPKYLRTPIEWHERKKLQKLAAERGLVICPKVRLLDIIEPRKGAANYKSLFYKVQAKHVDFLICDRAMHIKAVLELDDNSHDQKDRQERDAFVDQILTSVGYKVIRTHSITETTLDCISTADSDPAITQEEI